ncbi:Lactose permease like protein [Verticillium longisporum]|uniref:Lactose permease like protein n=1 Tax=Verticillium longisporum TaxID=100787 RepID=A0A8I3AX66_VERLO|nr:Lactose permease like protein [Verticillium longisporum]
MVVYFANRRGRKKGLYVGYFFLVLDALLQTFTPNDAGFVISRFFLAKATCGTRNYASDWAWRIPSLLQVAVPLVVLPGVLLIPESPHYLISTGQTSKAKNILTELHSGGEVNSRLVDFEMAEVANAIKAGSNAASTTSWAELFATNGNRHRAFISVMLGIFAHWNGVGVVPYYLALVLQSVGIISVTHQTLICGCLQIWNLFFAVLAAVNVDRVGRRPLFLLSSGGMLISYIIISGLSSSFAQTGMSSVGLAVVPFLYIYYGFYDLALDLAVPASRLWYCPDAVVDLLAIFFNIFVNPIAPDATGWKYYIVFAVILVIVTGTVYFCYPETKGLSLKEMSVIFDGVEAATISENAVMAIKGADVDHKEMA